MPDCYIVGAGDFNREAFCPKDGDFVIAADGGCGALEKAGVVPDLCVGDFDSLGFVPNLPDVISVDPIKKDDTDTMLAINEGLARGFKRFYIFGGTGGKRPDHTVANIQALCRLASLGAFGCLVGMREVYAVIKNGSLRLPRRDAGTVSVFSLDEVSRGVTETGLLYSLKDGELRRDFPMGVSNSFVGGDAEISVKNGTLLIMWEDFS